MWPGRPAKRSHDSRLLWFEKQSEESEASERLPDPLSDIWDFFSVNLSITPGTQRDYTCGL